MIGIEEGHILSNTADRTAMNLAQQVGYLAGLNFFIRFDGDKQEEKSNPDTGVFTHSDTNE